MKQRIRIFYSELTGRLFATDRYRTTVHEDGKTTVEITGTKYDVTDDIGAIVTEHGISFVADKEVSNAEN